MKYMGSKRAMLSGALPSVLEHKLANKRRFVDMFTGSGTVAHHVAERYPVPVLAGDLQQYAAFLSGAVITRDRPFESRNWIPEWIGSAIALAERHEGSGAYATFQTKLSDVNIHGQAQRAISLAESAGIDFVVAYGGRYFSPWQALILHSLRATAVPNAPWFQVAVSATIQAASRCAASPGHTAQPFKSNTKAAPFLMEAWRRDVVAQVTAAAHDLCQRHAICRGESRCQDANVMADTLCEGDLAFIDPPYSSVHYSRFYHVLESVARGRTGAVSGTGRYPPSADRPISAYSVPTKAENALSEILAKLATRGVSAVVTFPAARTSNALSGMRICELAADSFHVADVSHTSKFSTLGGNARHRSARQQSEELIITLDPKG